MTLCAFILSDFRGRLVHNLHLRLSKSNFVATLVVVFVFKFCPVSVLGQTFKDEDVSAGTKHKVVTFGYAPCPVLGQGCNLQGIVWS